MDHTKLSPSETRSRIADDEAILVCAYDDQDKCSKISLEGSVPFPRVKNELQELSPDKQVIFYCA